MQESKNASAPVGLFVAIIALLLLAAGVGGYFAWDSLDDLSRQNRDLERRTSFLQSSKDSLEKRLADAESARGALEIEKNALDQKSRRDAKDLAAAKADLAKAREQASQASPAEDACAQFKEKIAALEAKKAPAPASGAAPAPAECPPDPKLAGLEAKLAQAADAQRLSSSRLAECEASLDAAAGQSAQEAERLKTSYDALMDGLRQEAQRQEIVIRRYKERLELTMLDSLLFAFGSSRIAPAGRKVLEAVARELDRLPNRRVYVVGHTDDKPVRQDYAGPFQDNWQLSADRSAAVVKCLIDDFGLDPARFTVVGRSYYQPAAPNDTAENRARNRRVEIVIGEIDL